MHDQPEIIVPPAPLRLFSTFRPLLTFFLLLSGTVGGIVAVPSCLAQGVLKVVSTVDIAPDAKGKEAAKKSPAEKESPGKRLFKMTTLFSEGIVYDFIEDAGQGEITIFDADNDLFILLDPSCRIQARFQASKLKERFGQLRTELSQSPSPFLTFAAKARFEESVDDVSGAMRFQSPWIDYALETRTPERPELVDLYFDYCDRIACLNCRINPGDFIPFIRTELNDSLRRHRRLPTRIVRTVYPDGKKLLAKSAKVESNHVYSVRISEYDSRQIAEARAASQKFRLVSFAEYQDEVLKKHQTRQGKVPEPAKPD